MKQKTVGKGEYLEVMDRESGKSIGFRMKKHKWYLLGEIKDLEENYDNMEVTVQYDPLGRKERKQVYDRIMENSGFSEDLVFPDKIHCKIHSLQNLFKRKINPSI